MAGGAVRRKPYWTCVAVVEIVRSIETDVEGRLILHGIDLGGITFSESLSVFMTLLIDDVTSAEVPRAKAREYIVGMIEDRANVLLMLDARDKHRRTWGADATAVVGLQNAQAIVGGPAGPPV